MLQRTVRRLILLPLLQSPHGANAWLICRAKALKNVKMVAPDMMRHTSLSLVPWHNVPTNQILAHTRPVIAHLNPMLLWRTAFTKNVCQHLPGPLCPFASWLLPTSQMQSSSSFSEHQKERGQPREDWLDGVRADNSWQPSRRLQS